MHKIILLSSLLIATPICGMKKSPQWTEKDFQLARKLSKVLNSVEELKIEIKKHLERSDEGMKMLEEQAKKLNPCKEENE